MKILLINHFPLTGSGSGVYTQNIANSLIKQGHQVNIIFPENEYVDTKKAINLRPVYFNNNKLIEGVKQLPFNFPCFTTHPRSSQTFYDLTDEQLSQYLDAFKEVIDEEVEQFKPDIIHVGHIWLLADLATKTGLPTVITAHGTDLIGYLKDSRFRDSANAAFNAAKGIITISKENTELVKEIFSNSESRVYLIPNGYDSDVFYKESTSKKEVLNNLGIMEEYAHVVSFVGKFTEFKGIDVLLKAAKVYDQPDVITVLAGNGDLFDDMQEEAKRLKIQNIKFAGNQPHQVLRGLYNIADVSLVPSRNEAFGLVVIEAGACGAPVIGTNEGGIPDIINDTNGILIARDDYQALAESVIDIIDGKRVFKRDYIADYTKQTYSQDNFVNQLVDVYTDATQKYSTMR